MSPLPTDAGSTRATHARRRFRSWYSFDQVDLGRQVVTVFLDFLKAYDGWGTQPAPITKLYIAFSYIVFFFFNWSCSCRGAVFVSLIVTWAPKGYPRSTDWIRYSLTLRGWQLQVIAVVPKPVDETNCEAHYGESLLGKRHFSKKNLKNAQTLTLQSCLRTTSSNKGKSSTLHQKWSGTKESNFHLFLVMSCSRELAFNQIGSLAYRCLA